MMDSSWENERVTLSRSFLRDTEGLWAEVLKLAAVVEDALNQSIHALCNGRVEFAEEFKHQKRAMDRWEVQIEASAFGSWHYTSQLLRTFAESPRYLRSMVILNGCAILLDTSQNALRNLLVIPRHFQSRNH